MSNKYPGSIITSGANAGYSVAFDGTGDYLNAGSKSAYSFGTGDFTVEMWAYFTSVANFPTLTDSRATSASTAGFNLGLSTAKVQLYTTSQLLIGATTLSANVWYHIAVCRSGTTLRIFLNGVQDASTTNSTNWSDTTLLIGATPDFTNAMTGYISNVRLLKGTALYTAAFTPPTQLLAITNTSLLTCNSPAIVDQSSNNFTITANGNAAVSTFTPFQGYVAYNPALGAATPGIWTVSDAIQAAQTRRWNMYDPYFNLTTLLLHGNGTNGAQNNTFLDSSSNNFTITRNGNTTQGTFSPFSQTGWGNYFGGDGNYITAPYNAAFDYGTGDFSVECFAYIIDAGRSVDSSKYGTLVSGGTALNNTNLWNFYFLIASGVISSVGFDNGGSNVLTASSQSISLNAWHHFVLCRTGTTLSMFVDGTRIATATYSTAINTNSSGNVQIARSAYGSVYQNWASGYFSNARIVKGTQPYNAASSTITQPTSALTAITNTSLLTCQSNRFIDNSTNAFAITVNGTPSVQAFSPFYPLVAYTPQAQGGSGYFDGTGDFLSSSGSINWSTHTNITINLWVYPTNLTGSAATLQALVGTSHAQNDGYTVVYIYNDGKFAVGINGTNEIASAAGVVKANTWSYLSVVKSGSTTTLYVNGTSVATNTTGVWSNNSATVYVGNTNTQLYTGYMSGLSIVLGTATAPSGVPTSPPTNITNTNTLLNFTNAGIIDSTGDNVVETVGNAQISTTQSKFGGSSMYFDGTGDYLQLPSSQNLAFGTGPYTVEMWMNVSNLSALRGLFTMGNFRFFQNTVGFWFLNGGSSIINLGSGASANTWQHIALVRTGTGTNQTTLYVNGTSIGTGTDSQDWPAAIAYIGSEAAANYFLGYLDDFRITKGYARYTGNFTPQTSQWQDQ